MNDNHERVLAYKELWDVSHKKLDEFQSELQSRNNNTLPLFQVLLNLETTNLFDFSEDTLTLFVADAARLDSVARALKHDSAADASGMDIEIGLYLYADSSPYVHENDIDQNEKSLKGNVDDLYMVLIGNDYPATLIHEKHALKPLENLESREVLSAERVLKVAEAIRQLTLDQVEKIEYFE